MRITGVVFVHFVRKMAKKFRFSNKIHPKKCKYLASEELPALVLALETENSIHPDYKDREWKYIAHQTAGVMCHQHYMLALELSIKPELKKPIHDLIEHYYESMFGLGFATLTDMNKYRAYIKKNLKVDCNLSFHALEEGYYPIDVKYADKLTNDFLPKNLDDFLDFKTPVHKLLGCLNRWKLFILGENSD